MTPSLPSPSLSEGNSQGSPVGAVASETDPTSSAARSDNLPAPPDGAAPPTAISGPPATIGRARGGRVRIRTGAWPAGGTPRVDTNSLEAVSDDVAHWIETMAQDVARAMMDGIHAPFAARISTEETARYFGETLFNPDGSLDSDQWWAEYSRIGPDGLAKAINGGAAWRRKMGLRVALPVSKFQETPVGPAAGGVIGVTPAGGWPGNTPPGEPGPDGPLPEELTEMLGEMREETT